jgi:hypothetical protein
MNVLALGAGITYTVEIIASVIYGIISGKTRIYLAC